jgi:hypothetical protein
MVSHIGDMNNNLEVTAVSQIRLYENMFQMWLKVLMQRA